MSDENKTMELVCDWLATMNYCGDENVNVQKQCSGDGKVEELLSTASKDGNHGPGKPDFIVRLTDRQNCVMIIECKADINFHCSGNYDKIEDYAVDGVLYYASYLKDEYNVIATAASGVTSDELQFTHFIWKCGAERFNPLLAHEKFAENRCIVNQICEFLQL